MVSGSEKESSTKARLVYLGRRIIPRLENASSRFAKGHLLYVRQVKIYKVSFSTKFIQPYLPEAAATCRQRGQFSWEYDTDRPGVAGAVMK
ncbi:hypothetical protein RRG08_002317 [Elysia crispata]|uniref:Uncharacterized protein n=1 Tax=Elysia crispata TaxID=231223 RepID=A0AAE1DD35_9GAST|nr:hypothetical protein RRG08_002317 [Elysia crispata]